MNITVFQSDKGDCLLVTSGDGQRRILVDGGMSGSYTKYVAPALGKLREQGLVLDLVYVSHIDEDHIAGVLQLLDDEVEWRVHDFHLNQPNGKPKKPKAQHRPPQVKNIWHNAFSEFPEDLDKKIGGTLVSSAAILSGSSDSELQNISVSQRALATSVTQALKLSRRIKDHLGIPRNSQFGGQLAFLGQNQPAACIKEFDPLTIYVLGPFEQDLEKLKKDWWDWHNSTKNNLEKLRRWADREARKLGTSDAFELLKLRLEQANTIGDRSSVTQPNLASLMLLVEENGKTLLLTGDGHATDILKGLKHHGLFDFQDTRERIHVNVLKIQHHGAEFNIDEEFLAQVTADHYIFCGNGKHHNPDLMVLEKLIDSRLGDVPFKASHPRAAAPFSLLFNSSVSATKEGDAKEHMREVRELVRKRAEASNDRMTFEFLEADMPAFELSI